MRTVVVFLFLIIGFEAAAQHRFIVWFPDKGDKQVASIESLVSLSQKAREKRLRLGIPFGQHDFPVCTTYVEQLRKEGHRILQTSRWLNAAVVETWATETELKAALPRNWRLQAIEKGKSIRTKLERSGGAVPDYRQVFKSTSTFSYGLASDQNYLLGIDYLHDQGYTGKHVTIAFLDAGYAGFHASPALDSTRAAGRLTGSKDFWNDTADVFWGHDHGTNVLTEVAGNIPGVFVGMAPHVNLLLALTDHPVTETHQDEFNYVSALEWADSMGADLVSASISYLGFDPGEGDYTFSDMDGESTIVAKGVKLAARSGMLIVNGAGNTLGAICTPCDADSILCVGGTYLDKTFDMSSSGGPTADGRIKPDVAAVTKPVNTVDSNGVVIIYQYGGTSSSTPLVSGLAACLLQKYPGATNMQMIQAIKMSAHRASNPDNFVGWGVPNARAADSILGVLTSVRNVVSKAIDLSVFPNPAREKIEIRSSAAIRKIEILTAEGLGQIQQAIYGAKTAEIGLGGLPSGIYLLQVEGTDGVVCSRKLVKL